jgi:hypothetical protein
MVGTWIWNLVSITEGRNFVDDWISSGPAVASLALDVLVAAIAFPLFLAMRERTLNTLTHTTQRDTTQKDTTP